MEKIFVWRGNLGFESKDLFADACVDGYIGSHPYVSPCVSHAVADPYGQRLRRLVIVVGDLKGSDLERRYREKAGAFFQSVLRRIRLLDHQALGEILENAVDAGRIVVQEKVDAMQAGERILPEAGARAKASGVWCVLDARISPPS